MASKWRKRKRNLCDKQQTQGVRKGQGRPGNKKPAHPPDTNRVAKTQPVRAPLRNKYTRREPPLVRSDPIGFLEADSKEPAHLSQLILLAGDIELNPGPTLCGICGSNSVKCTWCEQWIHQRCSGLSKADIINLAKRQTYSFECNNCKPTSLHPGEESPEATTRGSPPCVHPAQELKAAAEQPRRDTTTTTPQLYPGWEQPQDMSREVSSRVDPARAPGTADEYPESAGDKQHQPIRRSNPERRKTVIKPRSRSCADPAQQSLSPNEESMGTNKKRHPTEEHRKARNERRREKRRTKRATKTPKREVIKVTTWNQQGLSVHERNRGRLRRVVTHTLREGWEVTLISELRAKTQGVIWLGEGQDQVAVVHSPKSGIILSGSALEAWVEQGQKKSFSERTTSVEVQNIRLVSVYQPHWSNGPEGIEGYRHALEDELARTPAGKTLIIGGDHNAHIGQEEPSDTNGRYGLRTATGDAGHDLLDWCLAHELQWVNPFSNHKRRGTWFNKSHCKWYELDGFLMRKRERHRLAKKMEVGSNAGLSDHKPVTLHLKIPKKPRRTIPKPNPSINWEKLSIEKTAVEFRTKTEDLSLRIEDTASWSEIATLIGKAAQEVCGKRTKHVANPWTLGHEEEIANLHNDIAQAVQCRNQAMENNCHPDNIMRIKERLKKARREMKKRLKTLEAEWWDKLLSECQAANEKGDMGTMYRLLRQLGGRDRKPDTGTTLTTAEFKTHFEKVSKDRYEIDPSTLMGAVSRMESLKDDPVARKENEKLNEVPTAKEIEGAIEKIKDYAPGKDNVRIKYIKLACPKVKEIIVEIVTKMFQERASR